jgi:hypothetical protein
LKILLKKYYNRLYKNKKAAGTDAAGKKREI